MYELIFMKQGMYIMAPEHNSAAYFMYLSYLSVCLYAYPSIVARQRLGKMLPRQRIHKQK
jgi:hypothetical protein